MQLIFFLTLFISLFFLSHILTSTISLFFVRATRSYALAIHFLAILFLPGVIIHELAHWLIASLLFVATGNIEFLPQVQGGSVKLGSVQIAKTDPVRRFVIGIAPIIVGLGVLLTIFWYLSPSFIPFTWKTWIFLYVLFEVGNTMFSSKKDLEGILGFGVLILLFLLLLFFLKVPLFLYIQNFSQSSLSNTIFQTLNTFCLLAIGIDIVCIVLLQAIIKVVYAGK